MPNDLTRAVSEALDKGRPTGDDDGRETVDNRERGCGHLKPNSCYVRSDVAALSSADGEIPRFVELDEPIEYRENNGKGAIIPSFEYFPGNSFAAHYEADGHTTTPEDDIAAHRDRLTRHGLDGDHYGDITSCHARDILMSVGKTNWETPEDYIEECRERGLNLKIGVSSRSPPPVVEPLRTRAWIIHPHGAGEDRPAIIGYAYLTRNIFTTGTKASDADADIPKWAENYAKTRDDFDVVDRGEPIAEDDPAYDKSQTRLADHTDEGARMPSDADTDAEANPNIPEEDRDALTEDRDVATLSIPDEDGPNDVTSIEVEFGAGDDRNVQACAASFEAAIDDGPLTYNTLKVIVSKRDECDAGSTPSTDDLIETLVYDAGAFVPAYFEGGSNE
jgi:hypothetical protein